MATTDSEWKSAIQAAINGSPNASKPELIAAVQGILPDKAESTVYARIIMYAENVRGPTGGWVYRMRGSMGAPSVPPATTVPTAPPAVLTPTPAPALEPLVSKQAPVMAAPPLVGTRRLYPGEENAIQYNGSDPLLAGTKWFRRDGGAARISVQESANTVPWSVIFPNGDKWDIEIPTAKADERYIPRKLAGGKTDVDTMQDVLGRTGGCALFIGHAGVGKTASVAAAAGDPKWDKNRQAGNQPWNRPRIYRAVMANLSYEKLVGQFVPNEHPSSEQPGQFRWQDGVLTRMVRYGGVLIADEINFTQADVLVALNSLLDDDHIMSIPEHDGEVLHAHADFHLMATMNPQGYGYVGTKPLNIALKSRFNVVMWYDWAPDTERKALLEKQKPDEVDVVPGLKYSQVFKLFDTLRQQFRAGAAHYPPGYRDLKNFINNCRLYGVEAAIVSFLMLYDDPRERQKVILAFRDQFGQQLMPTLYNEGSSNYYS